MTCSRPPHEQVPEVGFKPVHLAQSSSIHPRTVLMTPPISILPLKRADMSLVRECSHMTTKALQALILGVTGVSE